MKKITKYVFDDEDRRLLSIEIPDNPCHKCYLKANGCCGCSDGDKYNKAIKPYKERNILDLAFKFKRMHKLQDEIEEIKKEIDEIAKEIEDTGIFD